MGQKSYYAKQRKKLISLAGKKLAFKKYKCLIPGCDNESIRSHSIQKMFVLKNIEANGMVISFSRDLNKLDCSINYEAPLIPHTINKASTFLGFCQEHDSKLFCEVENGNFDCYNERHGLILFLRNLAFECCMKRNVADIFLEYNNLLQEISLTPYELIQSNKKFIDNYNHAKNEKYLNLVELYNDITSGSYKNYTVFNTFLIETYGVACATIIDTFFMVGMRENSNWNSISFSFFPYKNKTLVSFAWNKKNAILMANYMNEIRLDSVRTLDEILFSMTEDTILNINKWNKLSKTEKKYIKNQMLPPWIREKMDYMPILEYLKNK